MLQKELLDYFEKVVEETNDEQERDLARRAVLAFSYQLNANYNLGERWARNTPSRRWNAITTQVDAEFHQRLQTFAEERGISLNRMLKLALQEHLEANGWTRLDAPGTGSPRYLSE